MELVVRNRNDSNRGQLGKTLPVELCGCRDDAEGLVAGQERGDEVGRGKGVEARFGIVAEDSVGLAGA